VKLQAAYEMDKQLAEDKLLRQYESEKMVSITDLRVTLANRKQQALEAMSSQFDAERSLRLRGLQGNLSQLQASPAASSDGRMAPRLSSSTGSAAASGELDRFAGLARKVQRLQEENATLKGSKGTGGEGERGSTHVRWRHLKITCSSVHLCSVLSC
jgi:hypothetical protein